MSEDMRYLKEYCNFPYVHCHVASNNCKSCFKRGQVEQRKKEIEEQKGGKKN